MNYLVEAVQRNRIVKLIIKSPDYDRVLDAFQKTKGLQYRETRMLKQDDKLGRILLKFVVRDGAHVAQRHMYNSHIY